MARMTWRDPYVVSVQSFERRSWVAVVAGRGPGQPDPCVCGKSWNYWFEAMVLRFGERL
jgi:hypothetical protein